MNEIFSAVFILTGLYLFSKSKGSGYLLFIIVSFLLALLSRESAICYIPLILIVRSKSDRQDWKETIMVILIPVIIFTSFRIFSEIYFGGTVERLDSDSLDLNPVKVIYKLFHYFINMLFPVKFLFEFIGFDSLEALVNAFRKPSDNLPVFLGLSISASLIFGAVIYFFFKILKRNLIFPLLFIVFALAIYLFSLNTAERFLYLPSAGLSILLGIFFPKLNNRKIAFTVLLLFVLIHAASLLSRSFRHKQAADYSGQVMLNLFEKTSDLQNGTGIMFENIPPKKFGIFFLSPYNFQANWDYNFPERKFRFLFNETLTTENKNTVDAVYKFNDEESSFERVR